MTENNVARPSRDADRMRRVLRLAARGRGWTSPNPMVGAVLVKDGHIIGEGFHTAVGKRHAEREALADARRRGNDPAGATMYVNLEPCCHYGRTPPCTDAIMEAGVAKVVVAHQDPNPQVNGHGLTILKEAGLEVEVGVLADEAIRLNQVYCRYICSQRPFVTLKAATTLDGKIATVTGHSKWVSGPAALRYAHHLRHVNDAVLVGVDTVIADDPRLTCRPGVEQDVRQPLRVVVDSTLRTPEDSVIVSGTLPAQTVIATTDRSDSEKRKRLAKESVLVKRFPADETGRVDLAALLVWLHRREVAGLLVEGGGRVHASFVRAGLADKLELVLAPKLVGGEGGASWMAGVLAETMNEAVVLRDMRVRQLGSDWLIEGLFEEVGGCLLD